MRVQISVTGEHPRPDLVWPEGMPVPRVDDEVYDHQGICRHVRHVCWYPYGEGQEREPFVYVVVGPRRGGM